MMFLPTTDGVELMETTSDNCENLELIQLNFTATNMLEGAEIRCVATDIIKQRQYYSDSTGPIVFLVPSMFD